MTDHKKEAEEYLAAIRYERAQVHATLYLAEQQRIANLIAAIDKWGGEVPSWPLAIREGLGIA